MGHSTLYNLGKTDPPFLTDLQLFLKCANSTSQKNFLFLNFFFFFSQIFQKKVKNFRKRKQRNSRKVADPRPDHRVGGYTMVDGPTRQRANLQKKVKKAVRMGFHAAPSQRSGAKRDSRTPKAELRRPLNFSTSWFRIHPAAFAYYDARLLESWMINHSVRIQPAAFAYSVTMSICGLHRIHSSASD